MVSTKLKLEIECNVDMMSLTTDRMTKIADFSGFKHFWKHLGLCKCTNQQIYNIVLVVFGHFNLKIFLLPLNHCSIKM